MARLVQKFGGSSVRNSKHILNAAKIAAEAYNSGKELVVVVSAMGDSTDQLIELAADVSATYADPRELDVLLATGEQVSIAMFALALQNMGLKARSFTGPQAGIITDDTHGFARIKTIQTSRLESSLRRGEIAVVAGFQGMTRSSELTTLGRGGSDTTAVALAATLKAETCDIYTDVDGVYTTDPRVVGTARRLDVISYEEMLALASAGAQVLNARSVELAMRTNVAIRLRSTFSPTDAGTLVTSREQSPDYQICGVACDSDRISIKLTLNQDVSVEQTAEHFQKEQAQMEKLIATLEQSGVQRTAIFSKNSQNNRISELEFNCEKRLSREVQSVLSVAVNDFPGSHFHVDAGVARISLVGCAVQAETKYLDALAATLNSSNIPATMFSVDGLSISAVVPKQFKDEAIREVHARFCQESTAPLAANI